MKNSYVNEAITDVDLAERFKIPAHRPYRLMNEEGAYKLKFERSAGGRSIVGAPLGIEKTTICGRKSK